MVPNIGIYSFIPTIIAYIVCIILFYKVDFNIIKDKIKDLLYAILNLKYIKDKKEKKEKQEQKETIEEQKQTEKKEEQKQTAEKEIVHEPKKEKLNEPIIIKKYKFVEPIFVSLAKEKDFEIPNVMMKEINYKNIKNANEIKTNLLKNLKYNLSSQRKKTEELSKSEVNLNINNDIDIIKKKAKHFPPIKKVNYYNNKKINENQSSEKKDA